MTRRVKQDLVLLAVGFLFGGLTATLLAPGHDGLEAEAERAVAASDSLRLEVERVAAGARAEVQAFADSLVALELSLERADIEIEEARGQRARADTVFVETLVSLEPDERQAIEQAHGRVVNALEHELGVARRQRDEALAALELAEETVVELTLALDEAEDALDLQADLIEGLRREIERSRPSAAPWLVGGGVAVAGLLLLTR